MRIEFKASPAARAKGRKKWKAHKLRENAEQKLHHRLKAAEWWRRHKNEANERRREKHFRLTPRGQAPEEKDQHILEFFGRSFSATIITARELRNPRYKIFSPGRPPEFELMDTVEEKGGTMETKQLDQHETERHKMHERHSHERAELETRHRHDHRELEQRQRHERHGGARRSDDAILTDT